jgi:hypothetical protein
MRVLFPPRFFNRLSRHRASLAIEGRILFKVNPEQAPAFRRGGEEVT